MNEIRVLITIKSHRIFVEAGGHKLSLAKGSGIGAFDAQWVEVIVTAEDKEIDQFVAIKWRSSRIGGVEGVQGLEQVESPLISTESGFNCPYSHNNLPIYLELGFNTIEEELIKSKVLLADGNHHGGNEKGSILIVGFDFSLSIHELENLSIDVQVGKEQLKLGFGKMILFLQLTEEILVLCTGNIDRLAIGNKIGGEWSGVSAIDGARKRDEE